MNEYSKKAVFLDFGDTLACTVPSYFIRVAEAMRQSGYDISDKEFESAYIRTDFDIYRKSKDRGGVTPNEYREWFFPILCNILKINIDPYQLRFNIKEAMKNTQFSRTALPGATELLAYLKDKGYLLGVISNNDGYTEDKCKETGIYEFFDIIADSTALNMIKPDPRIFQHVIRELGLNATDCLHVGDLYGSDVKGGSNAGLDVIWLNNRRSTKLDNSNIRQIENLSELQDLL